MRKMLLLILLGLVVSCNRTDTAFSENVDIQLFPFKSGDKAYGMPVLKQSEVLAPYHWRLSYLLTGVPILHSPENKWLRDSIGSFYPDTIKVKTLLLQEYGKDERLMTAFNTSVNAILSPDFEIKKGYTVEEALEVASYFFYCDKVQPDSSIQSKVCIGINGVEEANWKEDRLLLEAFCFEAIYSEISKDSSELETRYHTHKKALVNELKPTITDLDDYLKDVRMGLFSAMREESSLKAILESHYSENASNLAFELRF